MAFGFDRQAAPGRLHQEDPKMEIGNIHIENKLVLAPMAGITDMPFRQICKEAGAGLVYTEMISAKALYYKNNNTAPLLKIAENEAPVALQLFGNEPELMADEAKKLETGPYDIFDINMGCPVPKVVNNNEGSALMKDPRLAEKIVRTMSQKLHKPVTIKIRKGFDKDHLNAVEIAQAAEEAGARAIAVHGRTREEYYSGRADWEIIKKVKDSVKIPVMGSGDIYSAEDAFHMLEETGVDAVMIARGARGNPWIFTESNALINDGIRLERPSLEEIKKMILRHLEMQIAFNESFSLERKRGNKKEKMSKEEAAVRQMRAHAGWYSQGMPNASGFRRAVNKAETKSEFEDIVNCWT